MRVAIVCKIKKLFKTVRRYNRSTKDSKHEQMVNKYTTLPLDIEEADVPKKTIKSQIYTSDGDYGDVIIHGFEPFTDRRAKESVGFNGTFTNKLIGTLFDRCYEMCVYLKKRSKLLYSFLVNKLKVYTSKLTSDNEQFGMEEEDYEYF